MARPVNATTPATSKVNTVANANIKAKLFLGCIYLVSFVGVVATSLFYKQNRYNDDSLTRFIN